MKLRPGSTPLPGVSTTLVSNTTLAETFWVAAPVGLSAQTFGSLMRMDWSTSMGTSPNVIYHRSTPTALMLTREKFSQLGWIWV